MKPNNIFREVEIDENIHPNIRRLKGLSSYKEDMIEHWYLPSNISYEHKVYWNERCVVRNGKLTYKPEYGDYFTSHAGFNKDKAYKDVTEKTLLEAYKDVLIRDIQVYGTGFPEGRMHMQAMYEVQNISSSDTKRRVDILVNEYKTGSHPWNKLVEKPNSIVVGQMHNEKGISFLLYTEETNQSMILLYPWEYVDKVISYLAKTNNLLNTKEQQEYPARGGYAAFLPESLSDFSDNEQVLGQISLFDLDEYTSLAS